MRALRKPQREQEPKSPFVFTSERGSPFTTAGFARLVERAAAAAGLGFKASHPHMLRHACGFALANKGHDTRALAALSLVLATPAMAMYGHHHHYGYFHALKSHFGSTYGAYGFYPWGNFARRNTFS